MPTVIGAPPGVFASGYRSVPFTPAAITGLVCWFDASDASTFTFGTGTAVAQWRDKSANAYHASQATPANQPTRELAVMNGLAAVKSETGKILPTLAPSEHEAFSVFLVIKAATVSNSNAILGGRGAGGGTGQMAIDGYLERPRVMSYFTAMMSQATNPFTLGVPVMLTATDTGAAWAHYMNGVANGSGSNDHGAFVVGTHALGGDYSPDGAAFGGYLGEVIKYNRALTTTERDNLHAYLQAKWFPAYTDVLLEPFNNLSAWTLNGATPATIVAGRTGTAAQQSGTSGTHWIHRSLGANESADITLGFAYRPNTLTTRDVMALWSDSNATTHTRILLNSTGSLELRTGTSLLATSAVGLVAAATWVYIELRVKLGDAGVGQYELRVNGATVLGPTTADTKNAGTKTVYDTVRLNGATSAGTSNQFDDLYISTGAGAPFKGSISIP